MAEYDLTTWNNLNESKTCTVDGCERLRAAHGWCNMHYRRVKRTGTLDGLMSRKSKEKERSCSIDGCDKIHFAKGFCCAHYTKLRRHGGAEKGRDTSHGERINWILDHKNYSGDDCLAWPYSKFSSGYGAITVKGKSSIASRVMCFAAHGEPHTSKHHAAHTCGNGHKGCMNPNHIRWATASENHQDKIAHGTDLRGERSPQSILTEDDVKEIIGLRGKVAGRKLAVRYGVSFQLISKIQLRKRWKHIE